MQNSAIQAVQRLIETALGRETHVEPPGVNNCDNPFHPRALHFYNDFPRSSFEGVAKKPMLEVSLDMGDADTERRHRLERKGTTLVYTRYERSASEGTFTATGQALACDADSKDEAAFVRGALCDVLSTASAPLLHAMQSMRDAGLDIPRSDAQRMKRDIFGGAS